MNPISEMNPISAAAIMQANFPDIPTAILQGNFPSNFPSPQIRTQPKRIDRSNLLDSDDESAPTPPRFVGHEVAPDDISMYDAADISAISQVLDDDDKLFQEDLARGFTPIPETPRESGEPTPSTPPCEPTREASPVPTQPEQVAPPPSPPVPTQAEPVCIDLTLDDEDMWAFVTSPLAPPDEPSPPTQPKKLSLRQLPIRRRAMLRLLPFNVSRIIRRRIRRRNIIRRRMLSKIIRN